MTTHARRLWLVSSIALCVATSAAASSGAAPSGPSTLAADPPASAESAETGLAAFLDAARAGDPGAARARLTGRSVELLARITALARSVQATNFPADLLGAWLVSFDRERPTVNRVETADDRARLWVRYRGGNPALLHMRREDGHWKLDLEADLANSLALLETASERLHAMERRDWAAIPDD